MGKTYDDLGFTPSNTHADLGFVPAAPSQLEALGRGAAQGATLKFADEIAGGLGALAGVEVPPEMYGVPDAQLYAAGQQLGSGELGTRYVQKRDEYRAGDAAAQKAHPGTYLVGELGGGIVPTLIPGVGAAKGVAGAVKAGAALGAVSGLGGSEADLTKGELGRAALDTTVGTGLGAVAGAAGEGLAQGVSAVTRPMARKIQAWEKQLADVIAAKAAKEAEKSAASAVGSYGAARGQGSRVIERLGMKGGLTAEEIAANEAALATPGAQRLAAELAATARDELPAQLAQIESQRALMQTTKEAAKDAYAKGSTPGYAWDSVKGRAMDQVKRYAIPGAVGAVGGALLGDDAHSRGTYGAMGLLTGAASHRQTSAIKNLVIGPEAKRLGMAATRSVTDKLAQMAASNPSALGRFGPILQRALTQGDTAFAAHTFVLGQTDPEFQQRMQDLSKEPTE